MDYVYFSKKPEQKEEVLGAIAILVEVLGEQIATGDSYRRLKDYPEFPEVGKYPFKKGDRVFFVGLCHPKKWLNHWCAKGIEVVVFCNISEQFPISNGYWSGKLKMCLSKVQTLAELVEGWAKKEQARYIRQCFECLPEDLKSAIVRRPFGSQWIKGVTGSGIVQLPWRKLPLDEYQENLHFSDCEYFHCASDRILGYEKMRLLSEVDDLEAVKLEEGIHGVELRHPNIDSICTKEAWLIIGNAVTLKGEWIPSCTGKVVWTAYPGRMAISIKRIPEFDGTLQSLIAVRDKYPIAVKGVGVN